MKLLLLFLLLLPAVVKGGLISRDANRWTSPCIYAALDDNIKARKAVFEQAFAEINERTNACFFLVDDWRTIEDGENWILFQATTNTCSSFVGQVNSCAYQVVKVAPGCRKTAIMHEMMHALGIYHEQQRRDRDTHVSLYPANSVLSSGQWSVNFNIMSDGIDHGPYDFESIMHYRTDAFAKSSNVVTIYPRDPQRNLALMNMNKSRLSAGDIAAINYVVKDKDGGEPSPAPHPTCTPQLPPVSNAGSSNTTTIVQF